MIALRKVLNNRYYDITKQVERGEALIRKSDLIIVTENDLISFCSNNMVIECPDIIVDPEKLPMGLDGVIYHLKKGRKDMLLKQNYNEPPEE